MQNTLTDSGASISDVITRGISGSVFLADKQAPVAAPVQAGGDEKVATSRDLPSAVYWTWLCPRAVRIPR